MKNFEIFEVSPNIEKLRQFREEYIRTFEGDLINRIISRSRKWYNYNKGVYKPIPIEIGVKPIAKVNDLLLGVESGFKRNENFRGYADGVNDFINFGTSSSNLVKALSVKHDSDVEFFKPVNQYYYLLEEPQKKGATYTTDAIVINEDIYNMAMIQFRNFEAVTTPEDLSRYSDFFIVGNESYAFVNEMALEDFQRCGYLKESELEEIISKLETSQKAVLSLRK